jgi:hypothetical protein
MTDSGHAAPLEEQIDRWRSYLRRRQAIHSVDVAELEDHLREQIAMLADAGLATDEAFLIAVKRMGDLDALSREFAREHSDRLWKQLVVSPSEGGEPQASVRTDTIVAFCFAAVAALAIKVPALFGIPMDGEAGQGFYARNVSLFVFPLLTGYFAWKRRLPRRTLPWLTVAFVAAAVMARWAVTPRSSRRCTCRSRSGWWWASRTPPPAGARSRAGWTSFDSRASCSSTTY